MNKRGQVTLFIIVSVVLVLAIVLFFFIKGQDNIVDTIPGSEPIQNQIVDCAEFATRNAVYSISYQGGYNNPPQKSFTFSPTFFPYYYYEGESYLPSLDFIEEQMAENFDQNFDLCITSLSQGDYDVKLTNPQTIVNINEDGVDFDLDGYVTITKGEVMMQIQLSRYSDFYSVKLYDLYLMADFFIKDLIDDEEYYCITCLSRMSEESNTRFYLFPMTENVYSVISFENKEDPLIFNYVIKFSENNSIS